MEPMEAADRLRDTRDRLARAARTGRRDPAEVTLVAVSKTKDADAIRPLIDAGQRHFGENRVQEAEAKWPALRGAVPGLHLHLVGSLQSNKADAAVALFDTIHTVDRSSLVAALARAIDASGRRPQLFVQVNLADEPQKGGVAPSGLDALLAEAGKAGLIIEGLMAIPPAGLEAAPWFAFLAKLARERGLAGLSMGMSGDYEAAAMLGATHVRVGTALFGERA